MLTPAIKTVKTQLPVNNIDWPKSGCSTNKTITEHKIKKLKKYFNWVFLSFSNVNIFAVINIKKGLTISIGCNLKKYKSIHRLAPFTSTPIIGTRISKIKEIINSGVTDLFKNEMLIVEMKIMINKAKIAKLKCLEKKK